MSLTQATETPYEQHRDYVLRVLARRCGWLADDEREALLHDAYATMLEKDRDGDLEAGGMHPKQLRAYLTQTAINKALDEGKRAERNRTEPIGERAMDEPDPALAAAPEEVVDKRFDGARVREIIAELPARRQAVVKLRFFFDRKPEEIQRMLAISSRAYRRDLERAMRFLAERYELVREGHFCDSRREAILAYVAGTADEQAKRLARAHLESCPACARYTIELREAAERLAGALPLPALALAHGGAGRLTEAAVNLREGLGNLVASGREHATSLLIRADPGVAGYATAARPGAVTAAVVGCVALGGGATYCAVEGLPGPLLGQAHRDQTQRQDRSVEQPRERVEESQPLDRVIQVPASPPPKPTGQQAPPEPEPEPEPEPAPVEPVPQPSPAATEFGLGGSPPPAPSSSGSGESSTSDSGSAPDKSAPATEFGP